MPDQPLLQWIEFGCDGKPALVRADLISCLYYNEKHGRYEMDLTNGEGFTFNTKESDDVPRIMEQLRNAGRAACIYCGHTQDGECPKCGAPKPTAQEATG